jgi:hypothetical protein
VRNEDRAQWFKVKDVFLQNCKDTSCHYCGVTITNKNRSVDHKHPIAKGGGVFDLNNLALCCKKCNRLKSDYDYDFFKSNREQILQDLFKRINAKQSRRAEQEKWLTINGSQDLRDWFMDVPFMPEEENEIQRFRSQFVSLVRLSPTQIEFNFSEALSEETCELIKERVWAVLTKIGTPVKVMKNYVDVTGRYLLFENRVLMDMVTFEEKVMNKKDMGLFNRGQYPEPKGE